MGSLGNSMNEYKRQLDRGDIQIAYQGLMEYFRKLRSYFEIQYPDYSVPGNIYYGYMDMTYFAVIPEMLRRHKLKIAIVFVHDTFRFEVWLSGANRNVQTQYWEIIRESDWNKYQLASNPKREDFVIGHPLVSDPNFDDLDALTNQIESGALDFIGDVEAFLSKQIS